MIRTRVRPALTVRRGDDDTGATAVEYALLVALIASVIMAVVATLGTKIATMFTSFIGSF